MDQLRAMRVFVEVADLGSFAGAARALDMTPSVVTRQVAQLEKSLHARLLNRTSRSLVLTDVGQAYLIRARQILADVADADLQANAAGKEPVGNLKVLCTPAFSAHQLSPRLHSFADRYPGVTVELSAAGPVPSVDDSFDVTIVSSVNAPIQGDYVAHLLAQSDFVICASPQYLSKSGRPTRPEDLARHRGAILNGSSKSREIVLYRSDPESSAAEQSVVVAIPEPTFSTSHIDSIYAVTVGHLGLSALPSYVACQAILEKRLEQVLPEWIAGRMKVYVAVPSRQHLPAKTRVFVDFLRECFSEGGRDPWLERIANN